MLHEAYYEISPKIDIKDIFNCANYVKMAMFADDCVMYLSGNNWNTVHRKIQSNFEAVVDWTFRNNLKLNLGKTKAMIFSTRNRLSKLDNPTQFEIGTNNIEFVHDCLSRSHF